VKCEQINMRICCVLASREWSGPLQALFDLAIFVLPFGGAVLAGAAAEKAGPAISGPASVLGLVGGIWLFSQLMTLFAL
jgi:hypothetical protein